MVPEGAPGGGRGAASHSLRPGPPAPYLSSLLLQSQQQAHSDRQLPLVFPLGWETLTRVRWGQLVFGPQHEHLHWEAQRWGWAPLRAVSGCLLGQSQAAAESSSDHFPEGRSGRPSQEGAWQPHARCPLGGTPQATEPSLKGEPVGCSHLGNALCHSQESEPKAVWFQSVPRGCAMHQQPEQVEESSQQGYSCRTTR